MENNEVLNLLKFDQNLIDEALRRQIDGTCCLKTDDRDFIQELFNKTNQAIKDHVSIEEEFFLPQISSAEAFPMLDKHQKMMELLEEAKYALSAERALTFKIIMKALKAVLSEHEEIENQIFGSFNTEDFTSDALISVRRRISENIV